MYTYTFGRALVGEINVIYVKLNSFISFRYLLNQNITHHSN